MSPLPLEGFDDYATVAQLVQPPQVPRHRSHDPSNNQKRTDPFQFGSRYLEEGDDVFEFNAWDHVETDADYKQYAEIQIAKQRETPVSDFDRQRFNSDPAKWWNLFYKNNTGNFFKNRKWLQQEFPVLAEVTRADAGPKVVLEVGAGAGNTAFPIIAHNANERLKIHACDYSKKAVEVMRGNEKYDEKYIQADVWDVTAEGDDSLPPGLEENSVDVVVMVFIFSALAPDQWERAVSNIYRVLKPGGQVLFRDYGRGDLAQVRFKKGRYLAENFYIRGDGTRVYFFEKEELAHIWGRWSPRCGLPPYEEETTDTKPPDTEEKDAGFEILDLGVDRRLIVNRKRKLKMYRCWMQGRFRKRELKSDCEPAALSGAEQLDN
ncbi:S-adenosylmethionine-dependent methyltransferase [Emydomyces testavorans]|uniref:tRNA N(3)-methylcytidine methyltransferase n=1 Tax=Emydomyces testavorans TaxID=2070801 RepID=A0AAF0DJ74_9EURO|nr:S-adenosylmethionine-dependent methyltransferase [Emydomyces testavorans]